MRVFITGVTGFVGSHLAELLLRSGDHVLGATDRGKWREDVPDTLPTAIQLLAWDITCAPAVAVTNAVTQFAPDVVFHLAGMSIPSQCGGRTPTPRAREVNVDGTRHVLDFILALPSRPRLIFASTCHVYAPVSGNSPTVDENARIDPLTAYGKTKLGAEYEILLRIREDRLDACIVRGFHHIGPRQPSGLMLTDWLEQLVDETKSQLNVRCRNSFLDLIDVRDAAEAYRMLGEKGEAGGIYNLGSGKIHRSGDVLESILAMIERKIKVVERTAEEQWNAIANISRLKSLGWQPHRCYDQTISDMLPSQILQTD